jgi:hypothetical protein
MYQVNSCQARLALPGAGPGAGFRYDWLRRTYRTKGPIVALHTLIAGQSAHRAHTRLADHMERSRPGKPVDLVELRRHLGCSPSSGPAGAAGPADHCSMTPGHQALYAGACPGTPEGAQ